MKAYEFRGRTRREEGDGRTKVMILGILTWVKTPPEVYLDSPVVSPIVKV